jgi:thiamine-phosphate pyrophosphorylase
MKRQFHTTRLKLGPVYPITDSPIKTGQSHVQQACAFLEAGVRFFQVRDKETDDRDLLNQLLSIKALCERHGADFLVNDRLDLALASGASGVHLGQTDFPVPIARKILGRKAVIGLSTHTEDQVEQSITMDIDYLAVGPVFTTETKESIYSPLGMDSLKRFRNMAKDLPLVAIGGITADNIKEVWKNGADSAALISEVSNAPDSKQKLKELIGMYVR